VNGAVGTYVWNIPPEGCRQCILRAYAGPFNRTFGGSGARIETEAKGAPGGISLTLGRPVEVCGEAAWETDIDGLIYFRTPPGGDSSHAGALAARLEMGRNTSTCGKRLSNTAPPRN
jgi:hypothetical protein